MVIIVRAPRVTPCEFSGCAVFDWLSPTEFYSSLIDVPVNKFTIVYVELCA